MTAAALAASLATSGNVPRLAIRIMAAAEARRREGASDGRTGMFALLLYRTATLGPPIFSPSPPPSNPKAGSILSAPEKHTRAGTGPEGEHTRNPTTSFRKATGIPSADIPRRIHSSQPLHCALLPQKFRRLIRYTQPPRHDPTVHRGTRAFDGIPLTGRRKDPLQFVD